MQVKFLQAVILGILLAPSISLIISKQYLAALPFVAATCFYSAYLYTVGRYIPLQQRSFQLCKSKRYSEAIASCDQFLSSVPSAGITWFDRGLLLFETGRYQEAIASYDKALDCTKCLYQGFRYKVWFHRGLALQQLNRYKQAIANYDESLKYAKMYHRNLRYQVWYHRGLALQQLGLYREAISSYDRAMRYMHRYKRGLHRSQGDEVAIAKPQEFWYSLDNLWCDCLDKLQFALRRYEEAIADRNPTFKYQPDFGDAFYNRACCYAAAGDVDFALANLRQAIYLRPQEYTEKAKADRDWDVFRQQRQFQRLVVG